MSNEKTPRLFCTQCGAEQMLNAKFCYACGAQIMRPEAPSAPVKESPAETVVLSTAGSTSEAASESQTEILSSIPEPNEPECLSASDEAAESIPATENTNIPVSDPSEAAADELPVIEDIIPDEIPAAEEPAPIRSSVFVDPTESAEETPIHESVYIPPAELEVTSDNEPVPTYAPPVSEPAPSTAFEEKPKSKKVKGKQNVFLKFISVLLSIVLTSALIAAVPLTVINGLLTEDNVELMVDEVIDILDLKKLGISTTEGGKSISYIMLYVMRDCKGIPYISEAQVSKTLVDDFVKQLTTDLLNQFNNSLEEGEINIGWKPKDIYRFLKKNEKTFQKLARESGYYNNIDIAASEESIIANIEDLIGKDGISIGTLLDDDNITEQVELYLSYAQLVFSDTAVLTLWGAVALIALLLLLVNIGYYTSFMRACGVPAFIVGGLCFILGFSVEPILNLIDLPLESLTEIVDFCAGLIGAMIMEVSSIVFIAGLALIIISIIVDIIMRKLRKEQ